MNHPQDSDLEFLDTVVLDLDIESRLAEEYDGGNTDVLSDEMLRLIERDFE